MNETMASTQKLIILIPKIIKILFCQSPLKGSYIYPIPDFILIFNFPGCDINLLSSKIQQQIGAYVILMGNYRNMH